jgi:hypothetical protein
VSDYEAFIAGKIQRAPAVGLDTVPELGSHLFPFQRDLVSWALRRGRAALFMDTGTGKTACQLEWSKHVCEYTGGNVLILAPLAVAAQTVREGERFGRHVTRCGDQDDVRPGINITNYDRLHLFSAAEFAGVVLDESGILKAHDGAMRNAIIDAFADTRFKLACTATPAPNDYTELGNHSQFLGILSQAEMLAQWFVHDGGSTQDWRLKGHARESFWRWVCSWAAMVKRPSDLGYDDGAYALPPLEFVQHTIECPELSRRAGVLFGHEATELSEQREVRRMTLEKRVALAAEIVAREPDEQWLCWVDLNDEGDQLTAAIPGAVQVAGADTNEAKEARMLGFADGSVRVLVSKSKICGFGLNFQRAARMLFVGPTHSYEGFYQAVRRCWRFGQTRPVVVHVIAADADGPVVANLKRKGEDADRMGEEMRQFTREIVKSEVGRAKSELQGYKPGLRMRIPQWLKSEVAA